MQGKPFTKEQRENIIESLKAPLQRGWGIDKSCRWIKFNPSTVKKWYKDDETLRLKIISWQQTLSIKASDNIGEAIMGGDLELSQWWLKHRESKKFSTRYRMENINLTPEDIRKELEENSKDVYD